MKLKTISAGLVACALTVSLNSCSKSAAPTPTETQTPAQSTTTEAQPAATSAAAQARQTGEQAVTAATQAVQRATTPVVRPAAAAMPDAQTLIDKTKKLVSAQKYQDALNVINQLNNMKLSTEQQKLVDDVKAQIQNLMSSQAVSEATRSVGGLLNTNQ